MGLLVDKIYSGLSGKDPEHVHPVVKAKRMQMCKSCPKLTFGTNCSICACFVDFKTDYKAESCPIKRW
jgi:hypothetical protein